MNHVELAPRIGRPLDNCHFCKDPRTDTTTVIRGGRIFPACKPCKDLVRPGRPRKGEQREPTMPRPLARACMLCSAPRDGQAHGFSLRGERILACKACFEKHREIHGHKTPKHLVNRGDGGRLLAIWGRHTVDVTGKDLRQRFVRVDITERDGKRATRFASTAALHFVEGLTITPRTSTAQAK